MNKTTAHLIIGMLDMAALAAAYYVFHQWEGIERQIIQGAEEITVQGYFTLYLLMLIVPVVHCLSLIDWKGAASKWANRGAVGVFFLLLAAAFFLNSILLGRLSGAGFHHCAARSESVTFSTFDVYLSPGTPCSDTSK